MAKKITIYEDTQDAANPGWAYRIEGGSSGAIDGRAAGAVHRIAEAIPPEPGDHDALRRTIEWEPGDRVSIDGPGLPGGLGDLLDR